MKETEICVREHAIERVDDRICVSFEQHKIEIPNFEGQTEKLLYTVVCELQGRVSLLEQELKKEKLLSSFNYERQVPDVAAKKDIVTFLSDAKKNGLTKISILDLTCELNLPAEQVERIMDGLEGQRI